MRDGLRLDYLTDEVVLRGAGAETLARALACFDGATLWDEAATEAGLPLSAIVGAARDLQCEYDLCYLPNTAGFSGVELGSIVRRYYDESNRFIFSHPLWHFLQSGNGDHFLLNIWLIETYHFIKAANARLAYAVSCSSAPHIGSLLLRHYIEEYDHHKFFADSLTRRGFEISSIEEEGPIAGTIGVINAARNFARLGDLHYIVCSGLLEVNRHRYRQSPRLL